MTRAVTVRGVPFLRLPDTMALLPSTRDSTRARTSGERSFRSRARPSAVGKGGQLGLRHCYSTGHGECAAEAVERRVRVAGRPALEADHAVVAEPVAAPRRPPGSGSRRCPARSGRGRRRPGSRRSTAAPARPARRGSPRRSGRGRGRGSAAGAGCRPPPPGPACRRPGRTACPGWSTAVFRFSSVNTRPARSPSSASRARVVAAVQPHRGGHDVGRDAPAAPAASSPVPCTLSRGQSSCSATFSDCSAVRSSSSAPSGSASVPVT